MVPGPETEGAPGAGPISRGGSSRAATVAIAAPSPTAARFFSTPRLVSGRSSGDAIPRTPGRARRSSYKVTAAQKCTPTRRSDLERLETSAPCPIRSGRFQGPATPRGPSAASDLEVCLSDWYGNIPRGRRQVYGACIWTLSAYPSYTPLPIAIEVGGV